MAFKVMFSLLIIVFLIGIVSASPFDLSNASFDGVTIPTQDAFPTGLVFKPDGTKLFEVGLGSDLFYEYDCSDPLNLSSCVFNGVNISTQDTGPQGLHFKPDGTKLFEVGLGSDLFYEYDCSDAWNLSSCVFNGVNLSVQSTSLARDLSLSSDGFKLFELSQDATLEQVFEYDCSIAFDLSSCVFNGVNLSAQNSPLGMFFRLNGKTLYEVGTLATEIFQFDCSTGFDLSTCVFNQSIPAQDVTPTDIFFNPEGTRLYELGLDSDLIYQYSLAPLPLPPPPPPTVEDTELFKIMDSGGRGLGIFIELMAQSLPLLLIVLALVGIIVAVGFAIASVIRKSIAGAGR